MAKDNNNSQLKRNLNRVDIQVSIIIAIIVGLSFLCVYYYNYMLAYDDMLYSLKERSDSIYSFIEKNADTEMFFDINSKEDMRSPSYKTMKETLNNTKEITGVMYLYTAKKNANGDFIYVVDGLPTSNSDFRYPGDLIEKETVPELERALNNEIVYPDDIKKTPWGFIFVSYYPVHHNNEIIGVIGIEFEAGHQFKTFQLIRIGTPIIGGIFGLSAIFISIFLFRRISNPRYKDFANTDYLTNLKNRNAYELDISNLKMKTSEWKDCGMLVADLNGLKLINDTYGHESGDNYITKCGDVLLECIKNNPFVYRIGGDEFAAILYHTSSEELEGIYENIMNTAAKVSIINGKCLSIAVGYAIYDKDLDSSILDTYRRADQNMYETKKHFKLLHKCD